jgi:predicted metal-dependent hydrolase
MNDIPDYRIIRTRRKTIGLEISPDLQITVRAPYHLSDVRIREFVESKQTWILKHLAIMQDRQAHDPIPAGVISDKELRHMTKEARIIIPERVKYFAKIIGVTYGQITIRHQKTRWGSCSSSGNLNFNCMLMATSPELIDYVVVHELCHRKQMNHSPLFWKEVEEILPDYRNLRSRLREYRL